MASPQSMLNLGGTMQTLQPQLPVVDGQASPPSILKFGIVLPPGLLEAQTSVAQQDHAPVDLSPVDLKAPAAAPLSLGAPAPVASPPSLAARMEAAPSASPPAPTTAFVEPRPGPLNISAAPTVLGFSPALPATDAAPTRIGHEAVQPPALKTAPADAKGRPHS
jgi:hypothetical protein